jgi:hypothetical protein
MKTNTQNQESGARGQIRKSQFAERTTRFGNPSSGRLGKPIEQTNTSTAAAPTTLPGYMLEQTKTPFWLNEVITGNCPKLATHTPSANAPRPSFIPCIRVCVFISCFPVACMLTTVPPIVNRQS